MTLDEQIEELIMQAPCPRCGASPGEACVTTSGLRAHRRHQARAALIDCAVGVGWQDGYKTGKRHVGPHR